MLANVIPCRTTIFNRIGKRRNLFVVYGDEKETPLHISKYFNGVISFAFASKWGFRIIEWQVDDIQDLLFFVWILWKCLGAKKLENSLFLFV